MNVAGSSGSHRLLLYVQQKFRDDSKLLHFVTFRKEKISITQNGSNTNGNFQLSVDYLGQLATLTGVQQREGQGGQLPPQILADQKAPYKKH